MTTNDHIQRVRKLAEQSRQWEAQPTGVMCSLEGRRPKPSNDDHVHDACHIDAEVCHCPTCGLTTQLVRGALVSRGWSREDSRRVATVAPTEAASYPYLASVRVDGREVYRVLKDLAEATDGDVMADIEAALTNKETTDE